MVRHSFLIRTFIGSNPFIPVREKMAEWLKALDCKSFGNFLRRFESYFFQKKIVV